MTDSAISKTIAELLRKSSLLNAQEKEYWTAALPGMSESQQQKLLDMLQRSEKKVAELKGRFETGKQKLYEKFSLRIQQFKAGVRRRVFDATEKNEKDQNEKKAEALLKQLDDISE